MTKVIRPSSGEKIFMDANGKLSVPNNPIIPFIQGDGIGEDECDCSGNVDLGCGCGELSP